MYLDRNGKEVTLGSRVVCYPYVKHRECREGVIVNHEYGFFGVDFGDITKYTHRLNHTLLHPTGYYFPPAHIQLVEEEEIDPSDEEGCI